MYRNQNPLSSRASEARRGIFAPNTCMKGSKVRRSFDSHFQCSLRMTNPEHRYNIHWMLFDSRGYGASRGVARQGLVTLLCGRGRDPRPARLHRSLAFKSSSPFGETAKTPVSVRTSGFLVARQGLEPWTHALKGRCSTN